ncbi:hypothetical protein [Listeria valentina]|uniref:hypothetical protein n=1 Tax=Listeria valentina TaxID=2705293 RepID=UPI00143168BF|nr:hypothetical protein [Listeria valentina]
MKIKEFWSMSRQKHVFQNYISQNVSKEIESIDEGIPYVIKEQEIIIVKRGVGLALAKAKKQVRIPCQLITEGMIIMNPNRSVIFELSALENLIIEKFKFEELLSFIEAEKVANIFWLELLEQDSRQLINIGMSPTDKICYQLVYICREFGENKTSEEVELPNWFSAKLLAAVSFIGYSHTKIRELMQKKVLWKKKGRWRVNLNYLGSYDQFLDKSD